MEVIVRLQEQHLFTKGEPVTKNYPVPTHPPTKIDLDTGNVLKLKTDGGGIAVSVVLGSSRRGRLARNPEKIKGDPGQNFLSFKDTGWTTSTLVEVTIPIENQ